MFPQIVLDIEHRKLDCLVKIIFCIFPCLNSLHWGSWKQKYFKEQSTYRGNSNNRTLDYNLPLLLSIKYFTFHLLNLPEKYRNEESFLKSHSKNLAWPRTIILSDFLLSHCYIWILLAFCFFTHVNNPIVFGHFTHKWEYLLLNKGWMRKKKMFSSGRGLSGDPGQDIFVTLNFTICKMKAMRPTFCVRCLVLLNKTIK